MWGARAVLNSCLHRTTGDDLRCSPCRARHSGHLLAGLIPAAAYLASTQWKRTWSPLPFWALALHESGADPAGAEYFSGSGAVNGALLSVPI